MTDEIPETDDPEDTPVVDKSNDDLDDEDDEIADDDEVDDESDTTLT